MKRHPLTPRQIQTLKFITLGYPNKIIADKMGVCEKTVEKHRQDVMLKLDLHCVAHLTHWALRKKLVTNIFEDE